MILGVLLWYFIGKYFYDLAIDHDKSKWTWAIIGVLSYYVGMFVLTFSIGIIVELSLPGTIQEEDEFLWGLLGIPCGLITVYLFYKFIKRKWENTPTDKDLDGFIDAGL